MNIIHKLEVRDGILQNVMYVYYPTEYEFSLDFQSIKRHVIGVTDKIRSYALNNISKFTNDTVLLILNGVIVGSLLLSQLIGNVDVKNIPQNIKNEVVQTTQSTYQASAPVASLSKKKQNNVSTITSSPKPIQNYTTSTSSFQENTTTTSDYITPSTSDEIITLKLASGEIIQLGLDDYLIGVLGAEMPAEFDTEALKAQAVTARTYALKKTNEGSILTTTVDTQSYKTENELKSMWGSSYNKYITKIKNAVYSTKYEVITYNNSLIDALYFSTSNGKTEEPINVWKYSEPYLKSVDSSFEIGSKEFYSQKTISKKEFCEKLDIDENETLNIEIKERTIGNRVKTISIANKNFDGVQIRTLFGLNSADFTITTSDDTIIFDVKGKGHGVGMSQRGANILAQRGWNYKDILHYYYTGVNIENYK